MAAFSHASTSFESTFIAGTAFLLSPDYREFARVRKKRDTADARTRSFLISKLALQRFSGRGRGGEGRGKRMPGHTSELFPELEESANSD